MSYSPTILARAEARLKQAQEAHRRQQAQQSRPPSTRPCPGRRRSTAACAKPPPRILAAALRQGANQEGALAALRRENLALQEEERALLTQAGYPADALEDTPLCPLCGDRGWKGAAMCSCLGDLCRQEQIAELSSLLDLGDQSFQTFRLDYYSDQVDPQYGRSPREAMALILRVCRQYGEGFPSTPPPEPLPLQGPRGWGRPSCRPASPGRWQRKGAPWSTTPPPTSLPGLRKEVPPLGEEARQAGGGHPPLPGLRPADPG